MSSMNGSMNGKKNNEMSRLISVAVGQEEEDDKYQPQQQQQVVRWKITSMVLLIVVFLMMNMIIHTGRAGNYIRTATRTSNNENDDNDDENNDENDNDQGLLLKLTTKQEEGSSRNNKPKCLFCDIQSPPTVHEDKSYTITVENNSGSNNEDGGVGSDTNGDDIATATVIPMTVTYNYELYNGQLLYTHSSSEVIPNVDFDYALLGMSGLRNVIRDEMNMNTTTTNNEQQTQPEPVSLDEVYLHHLTLLPLTMLGAEVLTRDDYIKFPKGYGLHVIYEDTPTINVGAHLLSNKNLLAPMIDGSSTTTTNSSTIALAHKHCNECYYAPGKGSDCTPEHTGTLKCCGDSEACTSGGEDCACATNDGAGVKDTVTKYQIQVDWLISRDIDKFKRVDQWAFAAPACHVNLRGESIFTEYTPDNYCYNNTMNSVYFGGGSIFHQIELQDDDDHPYVETKISYIAPASGTMVWAQSHLHTGGVNATLRLNGNIICAAQTTYGTNGDEDTNARNEQNHLIHIDSCYDTDIFQKGGVPFKEGDVLTTTSIYNGSINDDRFLGYGAAGEHKNVMSMFFTGVVFDEDGDATDDTDTTYLTKKRRTSFNRFGDLDNTLGL